MVGEEDAHINVYTHAYIHVKYAQKSLEVFKM